MMLYMPRSLRQCGKCGEWKQGAIRFFRYNGKQMRSTCRACENTQNKQYCQTNRASIALRKREYRQANKPQIRCQRRQYYGQHREHLLEKKRQYYPRHKARITEYNRRYYQAAKQHINARSRQWYHAHRGSVVRQKRQYYQKHRELIIEQKKQYFQTQEGKNSKRAIHAKRKARKLAVGGTHTAADIQRQYEVQQGCCYYCQTEVGDKYHADHYIPLSKGGSNGAENIVIACPTCNLRKGDKMPDEFLTGLNASGSE